MTFRKELRRLDVAGVAMPFGNAVVFRQRDSLSSRAEGLTGAGLA
jgi:hypothetical protein